MQDRTSCWLDPQRVSHTLFLLLAVCLAFGASRSTSAQMPWPGATGTFGDLNDDRLVDDLDMDVLEADFASGLNPSRSDLDRNGFVDQVDAGYLTRAINFAQQPNIRLPQFYFSELRWGNPGTGSLNQGRFLEFGVMPQKISTQYTGVFPAGVFYIAISKTGSGQTGDQGIIVAVEDLSGMEFGTKGSGLDRCLVLDPYYFDASHVFPLPLPPITETPRNYAERNLGDPDYYNPDFNVFYEDLNVVHMLVYRRPSTGVPGQPGSFTNPVARPDLGQDVDVGVTPGCTIDPRSGVEGDQLPPWDYILDAVTMQRSSNPSQAAAFGCSYARGYAYSVGPDGPSAAPYHAWRCEPLGTWRFYSPLAFGADTPGASNTLCDPENYCGSSAAGDCISPHSGPFCSDPDCCNFVCGVIPPCCSVSWDSDCAALADAQCSTCGGLGTGSCLDEHTGPACIDGGCCEQVCALLPLCCVLSWDANCAEKAQDLCLDCGDPDAGPCDIVHVYPNCSDPACCDLVCDADPICCINSWDQSCVDQASAVCAAATCGSLSAGPCCNSKDTPFCWDPVVCAIVCAKDPYCCEVRWDLFCAMLADDYVEGGCPCGPLNPPSPYFGCFDTNAGPGCDEWACCDTVCRVDGFCCAVAWDIACVAVADSLCSENFPTICGPQVDNFPLAYSCQAVHATPGCEDGGCCNTVCLLDPACCDLATGLGWDAHCVDLAAKYCEECGEALTESCYVAHGTPSCSLADCCETVCATDPFCCDEEWDALCAKIALSSCADPIEQCGLTSLRPCEVSSDLPGCNDSDCCTNICTTYDPFCCEERWDAMCVQQVYIFCRAPYDGGRGDCLLVHDMPGCADEGCTATVCSVDPACCHDQGSWDQSCVNAAWALCVATGACPGEGSPFQPHASSGCEDLACCQVVCDIDPTCCNENWDASCVQTALVQCKPFPQWECPCYGSPFEIHANPGANDESCCSVVCQVDPGCCIDEWDESCVSLARERCCGPIGCGSGCNGDCFTDHDSPYCNDPYCCEAICQEDPYCCSSKWDGFCAELAVERCSGCGSDSVEAGCFVAHSFRGCNLPICCEVVCEADSYCCQVVWDGPCVDLALAESDCLDARRECGDPGLGDPCVPHNDACSSNEDCCEAVCAVDSYCCEFAWDQTCVELALAEEDCPCAKDPGDPCAGPCCESHIGPSCDNAECAKAVCANDPYCCSTEWDQLCAASARDLCYDDNGGVCPYTCGVPGVGSCCESHANPTCDDENCCEEVCAKDPYCCTHAWDQTCVDQAVDACGALCEQKSLYCGSPSAGDCTTAHADPYCDDKGCCSLVCTLAPECCGVSWDSFCAEIALKLCN